MPASCRTSAAVLSPKQHSTPATGRTETPARSHPQGEDLQLPASCFPVAILFVAPFAWLISASFQPIEHDLLQNPPRASRRPHPRRLQGVPEPRHADRDAESSQGHGDWHWFLNSAFVAITITMLQTFFNALCAYASPSGSSPAGTSIFVIFLGTMMVPGMVLVIPNYIIIQHIPFFGGNDWMGDGGQGWLDSYWGLIMPGMVSAFGIFLLRQYMLSIPDELLDAARIDGASEFRIFWSVVLPLCMPALAANAIFTFQAAWEDFFWPLIIIVRPGQDDRPRSGWRCSSCRTDVVDPAVRRAR